MISYSEALAILSQQAQVKRSETLSLLEACGKVAAANITGPISVPSFRNSAMDGFAVRVADVAGSTPEQPVTLQCRGAIAAGDIAHAPQSATIQIMTGAPVPEPFDAVIPVENVSTNGDRVTFTQPARLHENIRFPGEDVQSGQLLVTAGDSLTPEKIMLLAAVGIGSVEIAATPKLHILSTGKEITDALGTPLTEEKIYNSNAPYLLACAKAEGLEARYEGIIADEAETFEQTISNLPGNSVIISTGAVSKGVWDFIPDSLRKLGASVHFHRVNIRPGKPVLFATLPGGSYYFGLPGNPISAAIGFRFFVKPLLRILQSLPPELPIMARLEEDFRKKGAFRQFLKAELAIDAQAILSARILTGQESFKIHPMAISNAWVMLEEGQTEWQSGDLVPVYPYAPFPAQFITEEKSICKAA